MYLPFIQKSKSFWKKGKSFWHLVVIVCGILFRVTSKNLMCIFYKVSLSFGLREVGGGVSVKFNISWMLRPIFRPLESFFPPPLSSLLVPRCSSMVSPPAFPWTPSLSSDLANEWRTIVTSSHKPRLGTAPHVCWTGAFACPIVWVLCFEDGKFWCFSVEF